MSLFLSAAWADVREYAEQTWQAADGLPNSQVRAILQSHDRFLWLGTQEGLARFDGNSFTIVEQRRFWEMRAQQYIGLAETKDGAIWFSNGHGLSRWQDDEVTYWTEGNGLPSDYVKVLLHDSRGVLWVGTDRGLARLDKSRFVMATNWVPTNAAIRAIVEDHSGNLWVGTSLGVFRCSAPDKTPKRFLQRNAGLIDDSVLSLAEGANGRMWVGTIAGLDCIEGDKVTHVGKAEGLFSNDVRALHRDRSGTLWIGTFGGLQRMIDDQLPLVTANVSASDTDDTATAAVLSIQEDDEQNIWVGTSLGLKRLKLQRFKTFSTKEGLPHKVVTSVLEDSKGTIWVTTGGGVSQIVGSSVTNFTLPDGAKPFAKKQVLSTMEDKRGDMWFGTFDGLFRITNETEVLHYKAPRTRLADNTSRVMLQMTNGAYWFGNNTGLTRYRFLLFTNFASQINVPFTNVRALAEGSEGRLWVGSEEGVTLVKGETWKRFTMRNGLSSELINALYVDADETLWIGTENGGLDRFRNGRAAAITRASGIFSERIYSIVEDNNGNFWMGSRQGIFRVSKKELNAFADGKISSVHSVSYGKSDGMRNVQCTAWGQPGAWKSRDGRLWFATVDGVVVTDPQKVTINPVPPKVVLTEMIVDGHRVKPSGSAKLDPPKGNIEFHYTGISLQSPEKVRFKYMLDGFDHDWVDAGARREAYYNNLKPGNYRFRVNACNGDEVWAHQPLEISFAVAGHFYQASSFYIACTTLLLIGGFGLYWVRLRAARQNQRELAKLVAERTEHLQNTLKSMEIFTYSMAHDLRSPLRAVRGLTRALEEDYGQHFDATASEYSQRIHGAVEKMDSLIQDMLTYGTLTHSQVELVNVSLHAALEEVLLEQKSQIASKKATVEVVQPLPEVRASKTVLQQVLANLVSNGIKFVPIETTPHLRIWAETRGDKIRLFVRDNGIGIKAEHQEKIFQLFQRLHGNDVYPGTGVGLAVVRKGIERMGGAIGLESTPGSGSCFWIELPKA